MTKKFMLGIEFALIIIFTSLGYLLFMWQNTAGYFLAVIVTGFLGGALIVDFDRSLKLVSIAFVVGCILFTWLYTLPASMFGDPELRGEKINYKIAYIATNYSRIVLISFPVTIFSCLSGCFLGKSLAQK